MSGLQLGIIHMFIIVMATQAITDDLVCSSR